MASDNVKELRHNVLSKADSVIMGIAGTAPAYSLSASTAALVAAVGLGGPGSIVYAAIFMFGIAFAFKYLNEWRSDAGASYAWVGRAINPSLGFMSGWALIVASTLFMVAGSLPVGSATLDLLAPDLTNNVIAVTVVGAMWFIAMDVLIILGIRITNNFQKVMTTIEVACLVLITVGAFVKFNSAPVQSFSLSWFAPGDINTFMSGALVAVFYYWGWDVTANLTEETENRNSAPGYGGVFGMIAIFILFVFMQVAIQIGMTPDQIGNSNTNLLPVIGDMIFPRPWGDIAILAVIISTVATLETSLLQASRTLFAMGRDRVISTRFSELHPRFQTPWMASIVIGIVALFSFVVSSFSPSINTLMTGAINALGLQIAFYYGLTGFTSVWYYRKLFAVDKKALLMRGIWPGLSALFLWIVAIYDIPQLGWTTDLIALGALLIGLIPMVVYKKKYKSEFYKGNKENYDGQFDSSNRIGL
ncbi:amino acid transporter [Desulfosporosinus acidiphilus SJ4]|uniref:Amino acid transporter n=1 Tax=Desulfosporosinus acidiphilus (strain DSM 22704 / JCM 16185 / SJ4) TaxID=646529 RepID=I4D742_DESAJ|nr:APC family permease [Desulfosporosinus acidiphilus]AFM41616.1 amino acid transporter [Desulfosporosinus acidiphilus SJ4]